MDISMSGTLVKGFEISFPLNYVAYCRRKSSFSGTSNKVVLFLLLLQRVKLFSEHSLIRLYLNTLANITRSHNLHLINTICIN